MGIFAQIAKFANFAKKLRSARRKFAQKLRSKAKFAKNCDFARKGKICAKIVPRKNCSPQNRDFLQGLYNV